MRAPIKWIVRLLLTLGTLAVVSLGAIAPAQVVTTTPAFPPLGNLVRQFEAITRPGATAYALWTSQGESEHQVWVRIRGGDALLTQQLRIYRENTSPRLDNSLPPATALVREIPTNQPTDWQVLPAQRGVFTYYIDGNHRRRHSNRIDHSYGVEVQQSGYERGRLFLIRFEDRPTLDDYNDLEVEVAFLQP